MCFKHVLIIINLNQNELNMQSHNGIIVMMIWILANDFQGSSPETTWYSNFIHSFNDILVFVSLT